MTSVQERLKTKQRESRDTWSTREQLCLASSVLKSGDQNWISVSRSLKPFAEKEALRPPDWFSHKACANQYTRLLENVDTPKRKKRENGETIGESIVKRLTQERTAELGQILAFQRDEYQQLKAEVNLLKSGSISDDKLQKMWQAIEQEEREQEQKAKAHSVWLAKRQQKQDLISQSPTTPLKKTLDLNEIQEESVNDEEEKKRGPSTLLTNLLKAPSPTKQIQNTTSTAQVTSPTIASLLNSSASVHMVSSASQNVTAPIHHIVTSVIPSGTPERPSAGAPTLSMLLALPANLPKGSLPTLPATKSDTETSARSATPKSANQAPTIQLSNTEEIASSDNVGEIIEQIDDVIGKDKLPDVIDKDEINEIMEDIEELIKEEITKSPQTEPTPVVIETFPGVEKNEERAEAKVDKPISLTDSPESEMAIEEIDHSTSNIAEIIGTAIDTPKVVGEKEEKEEEEPGESKPEEEPQSEVKEEEEEEEEEEEDKLVEEESKDEEKMEVEIEAEKIEEKEEKVVEVKELEVKEEIEEVKEEEKDDKVEEKKEDEDKKKEKGESEEICEKEDKDEGKEEIKEAEEGPIELKEEEEDKIEEKVVEDDKEKKEVEEEKEDSKEEIVVEEVKSEEKIEEEKSEVEEVKEENISEAEKEEEKVEDKEVDKEVEDKEVEEIKEEEKEVDVKIEKEEKEKEEKEGKEKDEKDEKDEKEEEKIEGSEIEEKVEDEVKVENEEVKEEEAEESVEEVKEVKEEKELMQEQKEEKEEVVEDKEEEKEKVEKIEEKKVDETKETEEVEVKKEESVTLPENPEVEEESSLIKLSGGRAMKTYSKKQNVAIDRDSEGDNIGEEADYRNWKKAVLLVYQRFTQHKYASLFSKPITEEQAPGYHSVIFRPMDLLTIKKNIENGTIRSTMHFQRDVMLMFQNALMYNKQTNHIHKMAMEMQEDCLQEFQMLVGVTKDVSFRRETRTAGSSNSEFNEINILKRKRSHITPSPLDSESPRLKKRRKSEND
ncbi:bromodomain containing 8 [Cotesia typhae]|uniref:bromodomain containing 8 n=1 Tax=Cotesia typhae TaxID=2053667 RepID=UPI003D685C3D